MPAVRTVPSGTQCRGCRLRFAIGTLTHIYLAADAGAVPVAVNAVDVTPTGLAGDRYTDGRGTFSGRFPHDGRHVSLIAADAAALLPDGDHRRNLVLDGLDVMDLIGRTFTIGTATFTDIRTCPPCGRLDRLTGRDTRGLLKRIGGVRADVVVPGRIAVGDDVAVA